MLLKLIKKKSKFCNPNNSWWLIGLLCIISVTMSACSQYNSQDYLLKKEQELLNSNKNLSAVFLEGYRAGCGSGRRVSGDRQFKFEKDFLLYNNSDKQYATGWAEGYDNCALEYLQKIKSKPTPDYKQSDVDSLSNEDQEIWDSLRK